MNNVVTGFVVHDHLIAQLVEVWAGVLVLQVQDTAAVTFLTGCDCFPTWLFVRTLFSHIHWKHYCSLPLKTFLYKMERDGFTTQGITQLKKQLIT